MIKNFFALVLLFVAISAQAQSGSELKTQYIDCNDEDVRLWDKVIISLKSETDYQEGTVFLSSDVEDPRANSGVLRLARVVGSEEAFANTYLFKAENKNTVVEVLLPKEIIGKFSTFFLADLSLKRKDGTTNSLRGLLCFSRIYDRE